jgi:UDP-N-acetylglucosamine 2-epimerase (non-hydrolysing)
MNVWPKALFLPIFWVVLLFIPQTVWSEVPPHPVMLIVGTRPEAIKMIPLYKALKERDIPTCLCSTGQHAELLDDVFALFGVEPDVELKVMKPGQDLFYLTEVLLTRIKELYDRFQPTIVVVQGDTTSAMVGALAAFYAKIPVAHVEAGLRTGNIGAPFPEELNRRIITLVSSLHFAPTMHAVSQLRNEGVEADTIFFSGNTVIDALYAVIDSMNRGALSPLPQLVETVNAQRSEGHKIILLTAHRRESFGGGLESIFRAMKRALELDPNLFVIFPVHPNPVIRKILHDTQLDTLPNILILPPLSYHNLIYVMDASTGVATDSGGISEEAVSLKKPVLILRNETDRPEALEDGHAILVGTDEEKIEAGIGWMMRTASGRSDDGFSPFGDGKASQKISSVLEEFLSKTR